MKGMFNRLPSFSPDYCGASGVFYEMDGLTIMCDPGACTATILASDEPRLDLSRSFHSMHITERQAVFGMDQELLEKAGMVLEEHDLKLVVLLGTPIAATLAVDYKGLAGQLSRKYGIPGFGINTSSIHTYDVGEEKAFDALADYAESVGTKAAKAELAKIEKPVDVNVLGATPLNMWDVNQVNDVIDLVKAAGAENVSVWGRNGKLPEISKAGTAKVNLVVSASALLAARKLQKVFGTPYLVGFPIGEKATKYWKESLSKILKTGEITASFANQIEKETSTEKGKDARKNLRALIVGEQVSACAIRDCLRAESDYQDVQVGSFFMMDEEIMEEGDRHFADEDDFVEMTTQKGAYDLVICEPLMYPLIPYKPEHTMPWPHTAVSGRIYMNRGANIFGEKGSAYIREKLGESNA